MLCLLKLLSSPFLHSLCSVSPRRAPADSTYIPSLPCSGRSQAGPKGTGRGGLSDTLLWSAPQPVSTDLFEFTQSCKTEMPELNPASPNRHLASCPWFLHHSNILAILFCILFLDCELQLHLLWFMPCHSNALLLSFGFFPSCSLPPSLPNHFYLFACLPPVFFLPFLYSFNIGHWTQDLVHTRQVLYHWATSQDPVFFLFLSQEVVGKPSRSPWSLFRDMPSPRWH